MANALYEHMKILTDGDFLLSPSLTNIYEALHGNGIMLLEDGATSTSGIRNTPASLPGYCKKKSSANSDVNILRIRSGVAVIDGMLVDFGGGYNSNAPQDFDIELKQSTIEGSNSALTTAGDTVLLVVYVCTDGTSTVKHIKIEMGSKVTSGFPVTPEAFLSDPDSDFSSKQSTVLAVVKCVYEGTNGTNNDLKLSISEVFNMSTYLRPNAPMYLAPMTKDVPGTFTNAINGHADMDGMHGGGNESGSLSGTPFDALWASKSTGGDSILLYSGDQDGSKRTWRLGPDIPTSYTGGSDQTFKFDGANVFHMTPSQSIELNPVGSFPRGHMIFIYNFSSYIIEFNETNDTNSGTAKFDIAANSSYIATFDGSVWKKTFVSTNVTSTAHGAANRIQISNGSGSHTSDAGLTYNASTDVLAVTGKITLDNLIENPTGIVFKSSVTTNPGSPAASTLWRDEDDDRLYFGSEKLAFNSDSMGITTLVGLSDTPANFTGHGAKIVAVNGSGGGNGTAIEFRNLAATDIPAALTSTTSIGPTSGTLTVSDDLTVTGDLIVSGNTTTLNISDLQIEDLHIVIAKGGDDSATDGAGIIVDSSDGDKTILWANSGTATQEGFKVNQHWLPSADSTLNIGDSSAPLRWANIYADNLDTGSLVGSGDLTIDTSVLKVNTSTNRVGVNQATPLASFQYEEVGHGYVQGTSGTGSDAAVAHTLFATTEFRASEVLISVENTTDSDYEVHKAILVHTGSAVEFTVHDKLRTDGSAAFCTVAADINGGNVRVLVTPGVSSKAYTFRLAWKGIAKV
tara:strand:+ start:8693 stop:11086 length:2394 start_codon:yes stop_codon:yes gene_type:complete